MPATPFLGGTASFLINGIPYQIGGTFSETIGGPIRTGKATLSGIAGFTQKYGVPMVDCELIDNGTISTDLLQSLNNGVVTIQYDNGKVVVYSNAWQEGEITLNMAEAVIKTKIAGLRRTEIPA